MPADDITAAAAGTWTLGDRTVNRMGFGSMRVTANPDPELAIRVLRQAVELGVNHIDTAAFYRSPGGPLNVGIGPVRYATDLIRQALVPYPADLVIATKVGPGDDPSTGFYEAVTPAQLRSQVEENLRRLGRDHLDVVNLRIMKRTGRDSLAERFGALAQLREAGLIRHLGLSNVHLDHLDEAQAIGPSCASRTATRSTTTGAMTNSSRCAHGEASRSCRSSRSPARGARSASPTSTTRPSAPSPLPTTRPRIRYAWPGPCTRGRTYSPFRAPATLPTSWRTLPPAC